jgi:hypothetical protein
MKNCLLVLCIALSFTTCFSQGLKLQPYPKYYHLIREAKIASKDGNSREALLKFAKAVKTVKYVHTHNWVWAAKEAKRAGECKLALKYLKLAFSQGYDEETYLSVGKPYFNEIPSIKALLDAFRECPEFNNSYESKLLALKKSYDDKFDNNLKQYLDSLYKEDQRVRGSNISQAERIFVDSSNVYALKQVINKYGYPGEKLVGAETAAKIFFVLLHYDQDVDNALMKSVLLSALHEGDLNPQGYAWIVDRRLYWGPNKRDPYYFQIPTKKISILSDSEREEIDKRRYLIGLKPLAEMDVIFRPNGNIAVSEYWTDY